MPTGTIEGRLCTVKRSRGLIYHASRRVRPSTSVVEECLYGGILTFVRESKGLVGALNCSQVFAVAYKLIGAKRQGICC